MIKKTIYFSKPCSVSLRQCQMEITDKETGDVKTVPIEDIGIVLVENQRVSMTMPVLNALADNNTTVVICNEKMQPNALFLPMVGNTVQAETQKLQNNASEPAKKQMWKQIIIAKIKNQAAALDAVGKDGSVLSFYYNNVKSGDSDNREGLAAKMFWKEFFDFDFFRNQNGDDVTNAMLNYGYSILRAAMSRAIVGSGLSLAYGVFHRNRYNAFPLADDLMEPYRPYVDLCVHEILDGGVSELNKEAKIKLLQVLTTDVEIGDTIRPLELALSFTTSSVVKYYNGEAKQILLPKL